VTDYKHEYQKYADDAVRSRDREEGFGRLRFNLFLGVAGPLACFLVHLTEFNPPDMMAKGILALSPLAVILLIINFIRLPNASKASASALLISLGTLAGAAANLALAKMWGIWK
jgi:hypothetical protein